MPGPAICGFHGAFESDFGDPSTPMPYPVVTPKQACASLLPFPCPHCGRMCTEFSDAKTREPYHDTREERTDDGRLIVKHNNYFCPGCRKRFRIDLRGVPVKASILGVVIGAIFGQRVSSVPHAVHVLGAASRVPQNVARRVAPMQAPSRASQAALVRAPVNAAARPKAKGGDVAARASASMAAGKRAIAAGQAALKAGKVAQGKRAIASGQRALANGQAALKTSVRGDDDPFADDALADSPFQSDDPFAQPDGGDAPDDGSMSDGGSLAAANAALDDPSGWQQQDQAPSDDGGSSSPSDSGGGSGSGGGSSASGDAGTAADTSAADADAAAAALAAELAVTRGGSSFDA